MAIFTGSLGTPLSWLGNVELGRQVQVRGTVINIVGEAISQINIVGEFSGVPRMFTAQLGTPFSFLGSLQLGCPGNTTPRGTLINIIGEANNVIEIVGTG